MQRARAAGKYDNDSWKIVRRWLLKANRIEPDAAWPLYLFYATYRTQGITPTANAVAALERAHVLVPQDNDVRMTLVNQYITEEKFEAARAILAPLAFSPHLPPDHPAAKLLAQIDARLKAGKGKVDIASGTADRE